MNSIGFENRCYSISLSNDALFVHTTASLLQHVDGSVAILCFRGTEPTNIINWLTDASVAPERFHTWGTVHGGFYRSLMPMSRYIACRLTRAMKAQPVVDKKSAVVSVDAPDCSEAPDETLPNGLKALYITGHSYGGALAALAAAMIFEDKDYEIIRDKVRGVYTYGQPRIGNKLFARKCQDACGRLLFRHIHANDIVPMFPPLSTGRFDHFGYELRSSPAGWVFSEQPVRRAYTALFSSAVGIMAWVKQQLPLVSWLRLPFSWDDHAPHNYVNTSHRSLRLHRSEFG
jgi:hypothetical protein